MIIRGEMGAIVLALQTLPVGQDATIYTDSLSTLWIIKRWLRRDFGHCLDAEGHPDVVRELVQALHQRAGVHTNFVWVPSHTGDPGNEVADTHAKAGLGSDSPPVLDRDCPDIEFWHPGSSGERQLFNFL